MLEGLSTPHMIASLHLKFSNKLRVDTLELRHLLWHPLVKMNFINHVQVSSCRCDQFIGLAATFTELSNPPPHNLIYRLKKISSQVDGSRPKMIMHDASNATGQIQ